MYRIPDHITWKTLGQGVVLLDLNTSRYYTLNETASLIWQGIMEQKNEDQITEFILDSYNCQKDQCRADVIKQIDYLLSEGLVSKKVD